MKKILYKTLGTILEPGPGGNPIRKSVSVTTEVPYSEEALRQAEATALPGTVQVIDREEVAAPIGKSAIRLTDRATGLLYEVYIENGQLLMEVI